MSNPIDVSTMWSNTYSGVCFTPFAGRAEDVRTEDICHALSNLVRFCGHAEHFYTVAEHSMHVMHVVKLLGGTVEEQEWGLLHDATEAYMSDVPSPVKRHPQMAFYREAEARLMAVIAERYRLQGREIPEIVNKADAIMLAVEAEILIPRKAKPWGLPEVDPGIRAIMRDRLGFMMPNLAKVLFRDKLNAVLGDRV